MSYHEKTLEESAKNNASDTEDMFDGFGRWIASIRDDFFGPCVSKELKEQREELEIQRRKEADHG